MIYIFYLVVKYKNIIYFLIILKIFDIIIFIFNNYFKNEIILFFLTFNKFSCFNYKNNLF